MDNLLVIVLMSGFVKIPEAVDLWIGRAGQRGLSVPMDADQAGVCLPIIALRMQLQHLLPVGDLIHVRRNRLELSVERETAAGLMFAMQVCVVLPVLQIATLQLLLRRLLWAVRWERGAEARVSVHA